MFIGNQFTGFNALRAAPGGTPTIRNHGFGAHLGNSNSSSTTYGDQATITFLPQANKSHVILAGALTEWAGSNTQINGVRLYHDTAAVAMSGIEAGAYGVGDKLGFSGMGIYTAGASPSSQTFSVEYSRRSGSGSTGCEDTGLFWMELGALDDASETLTENSYTGAQAWVDCHSRVFAPPSSGDYLVLACGDMRAATGNRHGVRLFDGTTAYGVVSRECKNATDYYSWFYAGIHTLSSSLTWKIQQRPDGFAFGNVRLRNMKLVFIRLDKFANVFSQVSMGSSTNSTTTPSAKNTHNFTPAATVARDHFVLQNALIAKTSGSNRARMEHRDGTTQEIGMYSYADASSTNVGSNPVTRIACPSLDDSASKTYDTRYQISATTSTASIHSAISVVIDLEEVP